jgi:ABC-type branched-subunit amino acid transport system permease subunit
MGRYVFVPFDAALICEHLLGLAVVVFFVGWQLRRTRLGLALLVIGEDETVARHGHASGGEAPHHRNAAVQLALDSWRERIFVILA